MFAEVNQRIKQLTEEELEAFSRRQYNLEMDTYQVTDGEASIIILLLLLLSNLLVACKRQDSPPTVVTAQVETPPTSSATYPAGEGTAKNKLVVL